MSARAGDTPIRIMDAAEELILERGLAGTTVDAVVESAGVTKGTFFYHFDTKDDLARALVERYDTHDEELMDRYLAEAQDLADDPLEQVLLFVERFEEQMEALTEPFPGCLFASYCYQNQLFDGETAAVVEDGLLRWRRRLGEKFRLIMETREPARDVKPEELADMLTAVFEGSFILSKTLAEPRAVARQLRQYRNYVELLFDDDRS